MLNISKPEYFLIKVPTTIFLAILAFLALSRVTLGYWLELPCAKKGGRNPPNSAFEKINDVDVFYDFSGKIFKAATELTPRDAELVAKVFVGQILMGMVVEQDLIIDIHF